MGLISIGLGNYVMKERIIAVVAPDSAPIKRIVQEAKDKNLIIDSTYGRRTRCVIVMDDNHIVLSSIQPDTLVSRNTKKSSKAELTES